MTRTHVARFGLSLLLALAMALASDCLTAVPAADTALPDIRASDNHRPGGQLQGGVLTLVLQTGTGIWRLDGDDHPGVPMQAFGEVGASLQIPGPLIRVPAGTEVQVSIRNAIPGTTLAVHGLLSRPAPPGGDEAIHVATGDARDLRFRLDAPGTYYYWGTTTNKPLSERVGVDSQLSGAIVVDPPGATPDANEEVLVFGEWTNIKRPDGQPRLLTAVTVINGRIWPHTARLTYTQDDIVRWRWINTAVEDHPLHLHGFYFRVDSRGDLLRDMIYPDDEQRDRVATEHVMSGETRTVTWMPDRPGNWLFHCHNAYHFRHHFPLDLLESGRFPAVDTLEYRQAVEPTHEMGGMVLGITVRPKDGTYESRTGSGGTRLVLTAEVAPEHTADVRAYRYVLGDGADAQSGPGASGPPIVLTRGVPASITVRNRLPEPTTVHWHGIELESYYDGAAGFGSDGQRTTPMIHPGQAFDALFTPPRAGTFIYHTHMNDVEQLEAGLVGPLIVLEPGETFDPARDHVVLITAPRLGADHRKHFFVNGMNPAESLDLRPGVRHRLRFINAHTWVGNVTVELKDSAGLVRWRALAKDGRVLPSTRQTWRPARQVVAIGETADFEFEPAEAETYRLEVLDQPGGKLFNTVALRVQG